MNLLQKTVAVYGRVSTDDQNLSSQLTECREWCSRNRITPTEYTDKASGSKVSRKALDRLMADVRAGKISVVVCYKMDRLGRSLIHLTQLIAEFDKHGVAFICTSQGIDTRESNPAGRFQAHILGAVAEFERSMIRERTIIGLKNARASGVVLGRRKGSLQKVFDAKKCYDRWLAGESFADIAASLSVSESSVRNRVRPLQIK